MPRGVSLWNDEMFYELSRLADTHTYQQAADDMGLKLHQVKSAASRFKLSFCNSKKKRNDEIIELVAGGEELKDVADKYGLTRQRVSQICLGV